MRHTSEPGAGVSDPLGLRCWKCGHARLRVVYTRAAAGGKVVRRRACRQCGARLTTWERPVGHRPTADDMPFGDP
jgi:hypothetical protein